MKAKMGRQYVLHSSASALRAVSSPAAESAQARTTLQRVVEKRSGDRLPSVTVSGVTVFDHRIYAMLGKLKRRRNRGVGAAAFRHGPLSASHHPLSKEALGDASPLFFSEIFAAKFLKMKKIRGSTSGCRCESLRVYTA